MNILFLDLSTKSSGVAIGNEDGDLLYYDCIQSSSSNVIQRIIVMRDGIQQIIKEYNIQKIVAEEVHADTPNNHTNKVLLWLQGVIAVLAFETIVPPIEIEFVQASSWRSKIGIKTGRGIKRSEVKQADMDYVKNKYGIEANDDICDAICLHNAYYSSNPEKTCAF